MMQPVLFEIADMPVQGPVTVKVDHSFEIKITAKQAQRQVDRWLLNDVSYMMGADKPTLMIAQAIVWQVPAYLNIPSLGRVGLVGLVQVDISTGDMGELAQLKTEIIAQAERLTANLPPFQPRQTVPAKYQAVNYPKAPEFIIDCEGQLKPRELAR
ncbi:hypothetical protein QUF58_11160 [Anaerolineales bacterium HSG24]|nr:hypothetical protein [Anaerolineales bacterium HSG24]